MRLLMHPDLRRKITDEAIQGATERDVSDSDESVEITTKTTITKPAITVEDADDSLADEDNAEEQSESEQSSFGGSEDDASALEEHGPKISAPGPPPSRSIRSILTEKHDLLFRMNRLMTRGGTQSRTMSASDSLDELRAEYERMRRELDTEQSVKFQRSVLVSFATGLEFLNNRFDVAGVRLDGWSESINQDITSFDEVFEELHEKYGQKSTLPPELKLIFMIASSAFMFHMSKSVCSGVPGMQEMMRDDPEFAKSVAAAVARKASRSDSSSANRGSANLFANILGVGKSDGPSIRGQPMTMPDQEGLEQLFSDSESGSEASSARSSSSSTRSKRNKNRQKSANNDGDGTFILDA